MKTIWKYPLATVDRQTIEAPPSFKPLTIQLQDETPCLWVEVDPYEVKVPIKIVLRGTGWLFVPNGGEQYIGTIQMRSGLIWHFFYIPPGT